MKTKLPTEILIGVFHVKQGESYDIAQTYAGYCESIRVEEDRDVPIVLKRTIGNRWYISVEVPGLVDHYYFGPTRNAVTCGAELGKAQVCVLQPYSFSVAKWVRDGRATLIHPWRVEDREDRYYPVLVGPIESWRIS